MLKKRKKHGMHKLKNKIDNYLEQLKHWWTDKYILYMGEFTIEFNRIFVLLMFLILITLIHLLIQL